MSESLDLKRILDGWPFDQENNLRIIRGDDGRDVLQMRTPLGVEQFEMTGRPDGARPHGKESVLEHYLSLLTAARAAGQEASFELSPEQCAELFAEGSLYYLRYLHCFQLKRFRETARDTERNLRMFDFINRYAAREEDQIHLEKWRPYILRMHAAARAMMALEDYDSPKALKIIQGAIERIEALEDIDDQTFDFEKERSLKALRGTAEQIRSSQPVSKTEQLERDLKQAIASEEFERAAELRDQLKELRQRGKASRDLAG